MIQFLKTRVRFRFISILTLLFIFTSAPAQEKDWIDVASIDSSSIRQRMIDSSLVLELRDDYAFRYTKGPKSGETLWERIKRWFYESFIAPLVQGGGRGLGNFLMLLLAIGGVFIMFYFFFKNRKSTAIDKRDVTWGDVFANPTEIEEQQFNRWMQEAELKPDYNEALKFLYLKCIRQMDKKNLIHYRPEYTNRQVLNKLKNKDVKEIFKQVSRQFEFVWYGHFEMDEAAYFQLKKLVNQSVLGL